MVIRYLDLLLDAKITFWADIQSPAQKAETMVGMLWRIVSNVLGPRCSKRIVLISVMHSILPYETAIKPDALHVNKYGRMMASVQRKMCIDPLELLAPERRSIYLQKTEDPSPDVRERVRQRSFQEWEERWRREKMGRWTARLIDNITTWVNRDHKENY